MTDHVDDYLRELDSVAGARLSATRRYELVTDIREHIDAAVSAGERPLEVMDRLGTPREIVDAEAPESEAPRPASDAPRLRSEEYAALILLQVGAIFLLIGWVFGVILLWMSDRWTTREKFAGTLLIPGGISAFLMFGLATSNWLNQGIGIAFAIVLIVVPIITTVHLARSATVPR